jgi:CRP-like cAMP-binding protein
MSPQLLKQLEPFTHLDRDALATLARHCRVVRLAAGRSVATGDAASSTFCYLLKGALRVVDRGAVRRLRGGHREAARPLPAHDGVCLVTLEPSELLHVDVTPVAFLLERPPLSGIEVEWLDDASSGGGWRERFLRGGWARGSPRLLERVFAALEPVDLDGRERILHEGARGDAYFVVASGSVEIQRRDGFCIRLAPGDGFGEEAILRDGYRRASASMLERGRLMRLPAHAFRDWLLPAAIEKLDAATARRGDLIVDLDRPAWRRLDVRDWLRVAGTTGGKIRAITVVGGGEGERLRFAFLAARAGYEVAVRAERP